MSDPAVPPNDTPTPPAEVPAEVPSASDTSQAPTADAAPQAPDGGMPAATASEVAMIETPVPEAAVSAGAPSTAAAPGMSPAACGAKLAELFPALFGTDGPPKPIKLRIHVDLQARAPGVFSRRVLGPFFARYTTSNAYLKVLSTATERFDLDGQPAGEVTEEHRAAALTELARRREIAIAKRAAERGAARPPARARGADGTAGEASAEAPRPVRGERRDGRRDAARPGGREGPGGERGAPRGDRPPRPPRDGRPARGEAPGPRRSDARPDRHAPQDRRPDARPAQRPDRATEPPEPQDPAQRERALLLRQFESSPLTKANFCVLKRIAEAELDAQLDLARRERAERHKR